MARLLDHALGWVIRERQKRIPFNPHNPFLEGPFAPVLTEVSETRLNVTGRIPPELDGILARIGPNPRRVANPGAYHWFMGDGMVHGLRLRDGAALWYRNRWIGSDSVRRAAGERPLPGPRRGVTDVVNTNIIGHAGKIWALVEAGSYPVELDGELDSVRHGLFDTGLESGFTAHPHRDPDTGELHAVCYDPMIRNRLRYLVIDRHGGLARKVDIPVRHGPMIHDCAITRRYAVILDLPVTFSVRASLEGAGLPYVWNPDHEGRVGLLPRDGDAASIRWFPVSPCYVFHPCNAYDLEDGSVIMDVVVHERMFDRSRIGPDSQYVTFERWKMDASTGRVIRTVLSSENQEFPRFDERLTGRDYRYAYAVGIDIDNPQPNALLRHDLRTGNTVRHVYGNGWLSGEAVFVPRHDAAAEDDGWLLSYVHDLHGGPSRVVILNAGDLDGEPQAVIDLPARVPLGFHGNWIPDGG